jgi:hypothetical protein
MHTVLQISPPIKSGSFLRHKIILSPLNLTIIFCLIPYIQSLGYPSHSLSEPLTNVIENKVATAGRPPRRKPMSVEDVKPDHPDKTLCTVLFSYELAYLAQLFRPLLSFSLNTPIIPTVNDIYKYTFDLLDYVNNDAYPNKLVLIFIDSKLLMALGGLGRRHLKQNIRPPLDPSWGDEVDSSVKDLAFEKLRDEGLAIWSAINWDVKSKEASA